MEINNYASIIYAGFAKPQASPDSDYLNPSRIS
jgi:hypothetical protein